MPNYTEKYNLTKPLPTELYDIEVFNENMNKVENALVELDESTYSKEEVNKLLEDNDVTITVDHTVTSTSTNPVSGKAVSVYVTEQVNNVSIDVDNTVTPAGTNPVSGAAVATYVAEQIAAIANYEEVAF